MDTEQGTESTQAEAPVVEATSEGTQPKIEATIPNSAPEPQSSEPTIPYSRFAEVLRERNELRNRVQPQPAAQPQQPVADAGAPKESEFETFNEYIRADAKYHAEKAADARFNDLQTRQQANWQQQQEQTREEKAGANFAPKWQAELAKDPSLQTMPANHMGDLPRALALEIMDSQAAGALFAHLIKNPAEVYRLGSMSPLQAGREIERMESKLSGSTGQPPRKPSGNIPDLDPVRTGTGKGTKAADDMSQADVIKRLYPR